MLAAFGALESRRPYWQSASSGCAGVVVPGEVRLLWSFKLAIEFLAG